MVGVAWEVGVLTGLAEAGLDPAAADVIIGTSAGSIVGSRLRLGHPLDQLATEQAAGAPDEPDPGRPTMVDIFGLWTSGDEMTPEVAAKIVAMSAEVAATDEAAWVGQIGALLGTDEWPDGDLRVSSVGADGHRKLWSADDGVPLGRAVAASCAVPGIFPPVTLQGTRHVDGGVWSGGHADGLLGTGVDRAVFIGPLVGDQGVSKVGRLALEREQKALADAGIGLTSIVPDDDFRAAKLNLMDAGQRTQGFDLGLALGRRAAAEVGDLAA